jgi:hypothetical protein
VLWDWKRSFLTHADLLQTFLELALLNDMPRAATVKAKGRLKCATLGKRAFVRLLGPVVDIIRRNSDNYQTIEQQIQQQELLQQQQQQEQQEQGGELPAQPMPLAAPLHPEEKLNHH